MMKKGAPVAANPAAYVRAQRGWHKKVVVALREAVRSAAEFDEVIRRRPDSMAQTFWGQAKRGEATERELV